MLGYIEFNEAISRLLWLVHDADWCMLPPDSRYEERRGRQFILCPPDAWLTRDEYWAAKAEFIKSLRRGDNVACTMDSSGDVHRLPLWRWNGHRSDEVADFSLENWPILIDEERFEAWLIQSNVLEVLSADAQEPAAECQQGDPDAEAPPRATERRGRPPEYRWNEFDQEAFRIADERGGLPDIQARFEEEMERWCEDNWDKVPKESMIKDRVSKIYKQFWKGR